MARPSSDIDPSHMTVDPDRKEQRNLRERPEPHKTVKDDRERARTRMMKRAVNPGVMLEPDGDGWCATAPHSDLNLWELEIADAFGTRSISVVQTFMRDLRRLAGEAWDEDLRRWKADETELNAALAMVADMRPRTSMEAALAAQMVAVHWMQMRLSRDALNRGGRIMEKEAALAGKMARTFTMQLEAMRGIKGRKRSTSQKITVRKELHQHVHYHHDRGAEGMLAQPHGRIAASADTCAVVRSAQPGGEVVPLPSRKRQG